MSWLTTLLQRLFVQYKAWGLTEVDLGSGLFTVRNVGWLACGRHDEHSLSRSVQGVWYKELVTENEQYKSHISRWGLY